MISIKIIIAIITIIIIIMQAITIKVLFNLVLIMAE